MAKNCHCKDSTIVEGIFGEIRLGTKGDDYFSGGDVENAEKIVKSYTLTNNNRMEVILITWGATIVSLKCPDKYGRPADIVLGFEDLESILSKQSSECRYMNPALNQYFGCILGRCANRIKNGTCSIKSKDYLLSLNENSKHHLHGGMNGFSRQIWESYVDDCTVTMSYLSEDGHEGYPGAVLATIRFRLTADNRLEIGMRATTTKSTIVNLTHASMFNLACHDAGEDELLKHRVSLNCDRWTFTDLNDPIPTGAIRGVGGTVMDLRIPKILGETMKKLPFEGGFDHNFCVVRGLQPGSNFVARVLHAESGRVLEVYSNQPGVQFYTGARLPSYSLDDKFQTNPEFIGDLLSDFTSVESFGETAMSDVTRTDEAYSAVEKVQSSSRYIIGKDGAKYQKCCAFSIQPQNYPNAINLPHFPCSVLHPGQIYYHNLTYKFGVQLGSYM